MSSPYRLVALVGVVLLGAAAFAFSPLWGPDVGPVPADDARAYLAAWEEGDTGAMEELVDEPPASFATLHEEIAENLRVIDASYDLGAVDDDGDTAIARFTAALQLDGLGQWDYDGTLSLVEADGGWLVDWTPAAIHSDLGDGQTLTRSREMPPRAPILDRDERPLASMSAGRIVGLEPRAITDLNQVKAALQQQLGVDPADVDAAIDARYEAQLAGTPSGDIQLTAADAEVVEVLDRLEGRKPEPVRTTLELAVQSAAESALGDTAQPA